MSRCRKCDGRIEPLMSAWHQCPPQWDVRDEECHGDGEHDTLHASDAEDAAEQWVMQSDREDCEYECASGGTPVTVHVRPHGSDDEWVAYVVTGEYEPIYYVRRCE